MQCRRYAPATSLARVVVRAQMAAPGVAMLDSKVSASVWRNRHREEGTLSSAGFLSGPRRARHLIRFGQRVTGDDVPSLPARYRAGLGGPSGRFVAVRLHPTSGEAWIRVRGGGMPWRRQIRTVPLNGTQPPAPTPDTLELHGGLRVRCHDGYIGRLEGIALDPRAGVMTDLLVHVRDNVLAEINGPAAALAALLGVQGQRVLLAPSWAMSIGHQNEARPLGGPEGVLLLNASAEQVAAGTLVRSDGQLAGDIWRLWSENPALAPYAHSLRTNVQGGDVLLLGSVPSARHRATAEQDVWHVPGVLTVRNQLTIRA